MARFTIPRDIFFGQGAMKEINSLKGDFKRAFIVTGGVIPELGWLDKLADILHGCGMETAAFTDVEPDPSVETVMRGAEEMQKFEPDLIVAIGGGSAIDAAKAMWIFYEYPELTFSDIIQSVPKLRKKAILAAIPSTSGTGSEVTSFLVITDHKTNIKYPVADYDITPDIAILDTDLVESMPPKLVAYTGMDALTHAIEAYVGKERSSFTRPLAIHSIQMICAYLVDSYHGDVDARGEMHVAQCLAGMAFTNAKLGINHSLAHKLGAPWEIPHGLANAILLPYIVKYNSKNAAAMRYYANIARRMGLDGQSQKNRLNSLLKAIISVIDELNLPRSFKEAGVSEFKFNMHKEEIAQNAYLDPCTLSNPRETSPDDLLRILECAYEGKPVTF